VHMNGMVAKRLFAIGSCMELILVVPFFRMTRSSKPRKMWP
jgi:hypothetical protein